MPYLSMEEVSKFFPKNGVLANDAVSLSVERGEVRALVGENGAGKTTLMKILYGEEKPDSGRIFLDGKEYRPRGPQDARRLGIGMLHQHSTLVEEFSVARNIALGEEPRRFGLFYDSARARAEALATSEKFGIPLDPERLAASLSVGERQEAEILKLLHRDVDILILDEPTALLPDRDIERLFASIRGLRERGKTILLITHKVREVMEISDSVTVMRKGTAVGSLLSSSSSEGEIASLMFGGKPSPGTVTRKPQAPAGKAVLELDSVCLGRGKGRLSLDSVSFEARAGEILGVCALPGNGLSEIEDLVAAFKRPTRGSLKVSGTVWSAAFFRRSRGRSLAYVPSDRLGRGLSLKASVRENFIAKNRESYFGRGLLDRRLAEEGTARAIRAFSIKAGGAETAETLSGGNLQKLILARELEGDPRLAVFSEPSWGLDEESAEFVRGKIRETRDGGAAVLLLSTNVDEILPLADRILVLFSGRISFSGPNLPSLRRETLTDALLGIAGAESGA